MLMIVAILCQQLSDRLRDQATHQYVFCTPRSDLEFLSRIERVHHIGNSRPQPLCLDNILDLTFEAKNTLRYYPKDLHFYHSFEPIG